MPAAASAPVPPATNCLRVRRTSGLVRVDPDQAAHDPVEIRGDLVVRDPEVRYDVLADGVERAVGVPGIEDVPGVGAAVDVVDLDVQARERLLHARIVETWLAVARGDRRATRVAAEIDVRLRNVRLVPQEAH